MTRELAAEIAVPSAVRTGSAKYLDVAIEPTLSGRATLVWRVGARILVKTGGTVKASSMRHFALAVPMFLRSESTSGTTTLDVSVKAGKQQWSRTVTVRVTGRR